MLKARKLLYPFSLLYGGITFLRNKFYDEGIFKSHSYELPVIAVGNLSVGGTGKTPMVEYLIELLKQDRKVAALSRGYKRSSKGFHLVKGTETAAEVGDEPLQFKKKFPEVLVAVDESRSHGIEELLKNSDPPEIILLDDAFQHRQVKAGFYILLTPYQNLYSDDLVLPAGDLRESRSGAKRADVVVVTKCAENLSAEEQEKIAAKLNLQPEQELYFSSITYSGEVLGKGKKLQLKELQKRHFSLVTGIANPAPLVRHLQEQGLSFDHIAFPDHHNFTTSEIKDLQNKGLILTTEKDYMRLKNDIFEENLFYLPIQ
ncbi:MAG: tetraacyldisaccharide 4'-kinase, partial [Salinimicrobium sp.]